MSLGVGGEGLGWEGDTSAREQGKKILPRGKPRGSTFLYLRSHLSDRMGERNTSLPGRSGNGLL